MLHQAHTGHIALIHPNYIQWLHRACDMAAMHILLDIDVIDVVQVTPGGVRPKECVLELKSGATILEDDGLPGVAV